MWILLVKSLFTHLLALRPQRRGRQEKKRREESNNFRTPTDAKPSMQARGRRATQCDAVAEDLKRSDSMGPGSRRRQWNPPND